MPINKENTLVIYYSLTNNNKLIALRIADKYNLNMQRITTLITQPNNPNLFFILKESFKALMNKREKLRLFDFNLLNYQNIILCTPAWAGSTPPALNELIQSSILENKKIALCVCSASGAENSLSNIYHKLNQKNTLVGAYTCSAYKLKHDSKTFFRLNDWINSLTKSFN